MQSETVMLKNGESAIFGYGSLLLRRHMEYTLGRPYTSSFIACHLEGWHRTWDVVMPNQRFYHETPAGPVFPKNIVYLNVSHKAYSLLNGVLFVVRPEELEAFDRREWIYDRLAVAKDLRGVSVVGGEAYVYVGKPEFHIPAKPTPETAAVRRTYLNVVEEALCEWGQEFRQQYNLTTQAVPEELIIQDRKMQDGTEPLLAETKQH